MRSPSFSKFAASIKGEDDLNASTTMRSPGHSRNSSSASNASSPATPTFSLRSHGRRPSSSSSQGTSPESTVKKSALHKLVEEPVEKDTRTTESSADEPLCICDTAFCEHREFRLLETETSSLPFQEYRIDSDSFAEPFINTTILSDRRGSDTQSKRIIPIRESRGWPSITKRWHERKATSASNPSARSAPPSRASSFKQESLRQSIASHLDSHRQPIIPGCPPANRSDSNTIRHSKSAAHLKSKSLSIDIPEFREEPIDRQELAPTPLLPPAIEDLQSYFFNQQSPLQSPRVAPLPDTPVSHSGSPFVTSAEAGYPTPPLSAKGSIASIGVIRSSTAFHTALDGRFVPCEEPDAWAVTLGHNNFHISPEPYIPESCDLDSRHRLLEDWQSARREYIRHAAHVCEHHGPTSRIYELTEEKWTDIDSKWRANFECVNAAAEINGEDYALQPLPDMHALSKLPSPSLVDPQAPDKFPTVDDADIVGPMIQYERVQHKPAKRGFLKIFTDPAWILQGYRK